MFTIHDLTNLGPGTMALCGTGLLLAGRSTSSYRGSHRRSYSWILYFPDAPAVLPPAIHSRMESSKEGGALGWNEIDYGVLAAEEIDFKTEQYRVAGDRIARPIRADAGLGTQFWGNMGEEVIGQIHACWRTFTEGADLGQMFSQGKARIVYQEGPRAGGDRQFEKEQRTRDFIFTFEGEGLTRALSLPGKLFTTLLDLGAQIRGPLALPPSPVDTSVAYLEPPEATFRLWEGYGFLRPLPTELLQDRHGRQLWYSGTILCWADPSHGLRYLASAPNHLARFHGASLEELLALDPRAETPFSSLQPSFRQGVSLLRWHGYSDAQIEGLFHQYDLEAWEANLVAILALLKRLGSEAYSETSWQMRYHLQESVATVGYILEELQAFLNMQYEPAPSLVSQGLEGATVMEMWEYAVQILASLRQRQEKIKDRY